MTDVQNTVIPEFGRPDGSAGESPTGGLQPGPERPPFLEARQKARAQVLSAYYDGLADNWELYRERNRYYHRTLFSLFRTYVPEGMSVLELGCATGDLLAAVRPRRGVGVDLSERMVEKARRKYPAFEFVKADAAFFDTSERFDCILINNALEYSEDIQRLFANCSRLLKPRGRVLISTLNPLWSPLLRIGERRRLCTPDTSRNFVTGNDASNLLRLCGFETVKLTRRMLFPRRVPLFAPLVNVVAAHTPVLRRLCLAEFVVARPITPSGREHSVSVVVPCYNEAANVEECVRRVPPMGADTEVIVVDDGSRDGTAGLVRPELNPAVDVRCISYQPNRGKLHAVRAGFAAARGDILMILDADMTVPPEDLAAFYAPLRRGLADFVNGTRLIYPMATGSMKLQNFVGNKLFSILVSWLIGIHLSDTLCGTKAFFRDDYHHFQMGYDPWGDFDLLFGAAQCTSKFVEVPIHYQERRAGQSKMKAVRHTLALLRACWVGFWRVKYPPSSPDTTGTEAKLAR
jgi:SAM-dependent methyltransferase